MPLHIVGPVLFRRNPGVPPWLFATLRGTDPPQNTAMPQTAGLVEASIRQSGSDPVEIKIIINGHAHSDHAGALSISKQLSGAATRLMGG